MPKYPCLFKKAAVTAPAGCLRDLRLQENRALMQQLCGKVTEGETCFSSDTYLSASRETRLKELHEFWSYADIDAIWAARGGFGCIHLLEKLDWPRILERDCAILGHSDITVLLLALYSRSYRGPLISSCMAGADLQSLQDADSLLSLQAALDPAFTSPLPGFASCKVLKTGKCRGALVPVTLSVAVMMSNTPWFPDLKGAILVIEDVNEACYKIDFLPARTL